MQILKVDFNRNCTKEQTVTGQTTKRKTPLKALKTRDNLHYNPRIAGAT